MNTDKKTVNIANKVSPIVLVVDDKRNQVDQLMARLEASGFAVHFESEPERAILWLRDNVPSIALFDIMLYGERDTTGLELGRSCQEIAPEAVRICISRDRVKDVGSMDVLNALNLDGKVDNMGRLFEAFGDKYHPQKVIDLVTYVQRHICRTANASVECDKTEAEGLLKVLKTRFLVESGKDVKDPRRQFVEVVRRLAYRRNLPEVTHIQIRQIGWGRSRTLVFAMESRYGELRQVARSIIKIGRKALILQESTAYSRFVPLFLNHGSYPLLESLTCSRDLAGIAYGHLGALETGSLPPTFTDVFWTLSEDQVQQCLSRVFNLLVPQECSEPRRADTLKEVYERRFLYLTKTDHLRGRCHSALRRFGTELEMQDGSMLRFPQTDGPLGQVLDPLMATKGDGVAFAAYNERIVHGDLHSDNIVLPNSDIARPFLIDFAHTGPNHVFLDYIVLELSAILALSATMAREVISKHGEVKFLKEIISLETSLFYDSVSLNNHDVSVRNELTRLMSFMKWIRRYAARNAGKEVHANYFAGLGLASLACLGLPSTDPGHKLLRSWLALSATVNLNLANEHREKCTLWGPEMATKSDDAKIRVYVEQAEQRLVMLTLQKLESYLEVCRVSADRLNELIDSIRPHLEVLARELPSTAHSLESVAAGLVKDGKNKTQAKLVTSLGLGILAIQVEREIELPETAKDSVSHLFRLLQRFRKPQ